MSLTTATHRFGRHGGSRGAQGEDWRLFGLSQAQVAAIGLGLVVLLGAILRFYRLGAFSIGNLYYAATVKSMLTSWHNFFFAAYEPGGSVTVDKPPLGFWLQAASAYLFGVNGFALALPQAIAGTLSIPLLYGLVKRQFGCWAGLIAALALAVMPVAVSTERNNTVDGLLVFVLLLAAWAFWRATRTGRLGHLLLGAVLVGLGFNIKMLQAFLPLPAFYLVYLIGAQVAPWRRIVYLGLATVVLLAVSLSWAAAVDLTPAEARPYIGSSENNTVIELITGHNGIRRLDILSFFGSDSAGTGDAAPQPGGQAGLGGQSNPPAPPAIGAQDQPGNPPPPRSGQGNPPAPPAAGAQDQPGRLPPPDGGPGNAPGGGGGGRSSEVGQAGWLRLVTEPLAGEAGWLLPVALLGIPLALVVLGRPWPLSSGHLGLALWAGWLLPEVVYFTFNSGLWHAYYLIMLGPPLAALVGVAAWALWQVMQRRLWLGILSLILVAVATFSVQVNVLRAYPDYLVGVLAVATPLLLGGLALFAGALHHRRELLARVAFGMAILSLVIAPLLWAGLTMLNEQPDVALPRSGPVASARPLTSGTLTETQQAILDYLLAHTEASTYLVAGGSSHDVSGFIIETGHPALAMGGFNGSDEVVTIEELAGMVERGELRFVLGGPELGRRNSEIGRWVESSCTAVEVPGTMGSGRGPATVLYDCGG